MDAGSCYARALRFLPVSNRGTRPFGFVRITEVPLTDLDSPSPHRRRGSVAVGGMLLTLAAWLWPLGVGGRMPVGGDVTRFSIGLMAELGRSYRALRLPLWNNLWRYGFPALAESQMGVYYPPHLVLYGLLPTEVAYTASLVLHTLWAGLGTYWAARRFGAGPLGAALGGLAWGASGFFVIHEPHQWAYTVGSWMPWAWGLAWPLARGDGRVRQALLLAMVLALQILPGHFQLAFITEVSVLGMGLWGLLDRPAGRLAGLWGLAAIGAAVAAVAPLAALQIVPTYELARLAESHRDFEYLSGFAATPLHLVSYLAPGLFHRSPLWRPVAWDPFHTSPEEHMPYIGLAPLALAVLALGGWRREPAIRALGWLAIGSLALSFGPYFPGFATLIRLPGFSFFRAPARWGLATELAVALLGARGLTALAAGAIRRAALGLTLLAIGAALVVAASVGLAELALWSLRQPADGPLASALEGAMVWTPWGDAAPLRATMGRAMRPPDDPLILAGLWRRGEDPAIASLRADRRAIYREELLPTAGLLAGLIVLPGLLTRLAPRERRGLVGLVLVWTALDLLYHGHALRPLETAPTRPLARQSPVLAAMAQLPPATRVADGQGNLAMRVGQAPLPAYRTLDRPVMEGLTRVLDESPVIPARGRLEIGQLLGVGLHVYAQMDTPPYLRGGVILAPWSPPVEIVDTELARWSYGTRGLELLGPIAAEFRFWPAPYVPTWAWRLGPEIRSVIELPPLLPRATPGGLFEERPDALVPLALRSPRPEQMEVDVQADGPASVLLTVLDDPEWHATWQPAPGEPGEAIEAPDEGTGGGWIRRTVPRPGRWTLRLVYRGRAAYRGLAVSVVSWLVWAAAFGAAGWRERTRSATR